jgi:DNA-binding FadR family transcriptional regulator
LIKFKNDSDVRVPKAAELVAASIRRAIIRAEIASGENLPPEAKLLEMFEVSRPTIREALRILEFEDLISVSRGARGGAKVKAPSPDFVSRAMGVALQARNVLLGDVYQARMIVEPAAAKLAAQGRPKAAAAALRQHIKKEFEALDLDALTPTLTAEFHRLLMEQSGNQTLALISVALRDLIDRHQTLARRSLPAEDRQASRKRSRLGLRSHERLAELIEQGKAEAAESHWRLHMERAGEAYLDRLAQASVVDVLSE